MRHEAGRSMTAAEGAREALTAGLLLPHSSVREPLSTPSSFTLEVQIRYSLSPHHGQLSLCPNVESLAHWRWPIRLSIDFCASAPNRVLNIVPPVHLGAEDARQGLYRAGL